MYDKAMKVSLTNESDEKLQKQANLVGVKKATLARIIIERVINGGDLFEIIQPKGLAAGKPKKRRGT